MQNPALDDPDQEKSQVTNYGTTAMNVLAVDPDARLMLEVRDDNAAAFEELVLRYQDRLVNILEHIVHNHQWAEDLAQDVFLRVFRARKTYEPAAKFSTWLFTIANNVASNALRNRSRRKEVNASAAGHSDSSAMPLAELAVAKSAFMPARRLDKAEMSQVVRTAMESLSERQRTALVLNRFEHLSYQDIAASMGLTEKAVKSLLSRARVNLRQMLEPYLESGKPPAQPPQPNPPAGNGVPGNLPVARRLELPPEPKTGKRP